MEEVQTIRHATLEDIPNIMKLSRELFENSTYKAFKLDEKRAVQHLEKFIIEGQLDYLCVLSIDGDDIVGVVAAYAYEPIFSSERIAIEPLLYLKPEYRASHRGQELLEAYEHWARLVGCKIAQSGLLDTSPQGMHKLYKRHGYKLSEYIYSKEL